MTTLFPAAMTLAASVSWLAAIDLMSQCHKPWSMRFSAYAVFALLVAAGGYGIIQIHEQVEPWNRAIAVAMYFAVEGAGAVIGVRAIQTCRV